MTDPELTQLRAALERARGIEEAARAYRQAVLMVENGTAGPGAIANTAPVLDAKLAEEPK